MKIENFMQALKEYQSPLVFNPWRDYDPKCDISSDAPVIRAANLTRYLQLRQKAHYLFIAEGLGYQGGHFSGMAMTSERILLGLHPDIKPEAVLGGITAEPVTLKVNCLKVHKNKAVLMSLRRQ